MNDIPKQHHRPRRSKYGHHNHNSEPRTKQLREERTDIVSARRQPSLPRVKFLENTDKEKDK